MNKISPIAKTIFVKVIPFVLLLSLGFMAGYLFRSYEKISVVTPTQTTESTLNENKIPECVYGHCPRYYNWSVKDGMSSQTLIIEPTTMNRGVGRLLIIDEGKVIFKTQELPQINIKQDVEGDGFFLIYSPDIYLPKGQTIIHYKYKNGEFIGKENETQTVIITDPFPFPTLTPTPISQ